MSTVDAETSSKISEVCLTYFNSYNSSYMQALHEFKSQVAQV
jgi:hypothetical protein